MAIVNVPKVLRDRLTEEGTDAFVHVLEKLERHTENTVMQAAEGRFERRLISVQSDLELKIEKLRSELKVEIAKTRADIIQWMFIFMFGQYWLIVGTITGILFAFFRKQSL